MKMEKFKKVNMKDKVVTISKVTLSGEEIQGALITSNR